MDVLACSAAVKTAVLKIASFGAPGLQEPDFGSDTGFWEEITRAPVVSII